MQRGASRARGRPRDARVMVGPMPAGPIPSLILFDGECNLCHGTVRFVVARDRAARFRFAPLASAVGRTALHRAGLPAGWTDGVVLIEGERAFVKSDATLRIARGLDGAWPLAGALLLVPRFLRDGVYDFVASRRYAWFGRRDACTVPSPELQARLLS